MPLTDLYQTLLVIMPKRHIVVDAIASWFNQIQLERLVRRNIIEEKEVEVKRWRVHKKVRKVVLVCEQDPA